MSGIVDYCQCLLAAGCVFIYLFLVTHEDLFDGGHAEVGLLENLEVRVEAVSFNISAKEFYILTDFGEVCETKLFWASVSA